MMTRLSIFFKDLKSDFISDFLEHYSTCPLANDWHETMKLGTLISIFHRDWMVQQVTLNLYSVQVLTGAHNLLITALVN